MLPQSVVLRKENNLLYWKNTSFKISVEDAKTVAAEVLKLAQRPEITLMLVDNRGAKGGAWPQDVNPIWSELMGNLAKHIEKSATVADVTVVMQINRLSKTSGTLEQVQAFEDIQQAKTFLGVSQLPIE